MLATHDYQLDLIKINKYQLFLDAFLALNAEQMQSAITEEFFDDILTVFTVCMEFVKIFSCMIRSNFAKALDEKSIEERKVFQNKLEKDCSILPGREYSTGNVIAGKFLSGNINNGIEDESQNSNSKVDIGSSDSRSSNNSDMRYMASRDVNTSMQCHGKAMPHGNHNSDMIIDSNIKSDTSIDMNTNRNTNRNTEITIKIPVQVHVPMVITGISIDNNYLLLPITNTPTHTDRNTDMNTNKNTNTNSHMYTSTNMSVTAQSTTPKEILRELYESSLSVSILYCNTYFSAKHSNLRDKQRGTDSIGLKTIEDKMIAR